MNKPYAVYFTGEIVSSADHNTVKSNLVLSTGLSDNKADALLNSNGLLLKRFSSCSEAELLADKFYQAGAICEIRDFRLASENPGAEVSGESSLLRVLKHFSAKGNGNSSNKKKQA